MGFSLSNAMAGAAEGVSKVAGDYIQTQVRKNAEGELIDKRAALDDARAQRVEVWAREREGRSNDFQLRRDAEGRAFEGEQKGLDRGVQADNSRRQYDVGMAGVEQRRTEASERIRLGERELADNERRTNAIIAREGRAGAGKPDKSATIAGITDVLETTSKASERWAKIAADAATDPRERERAAEIANMYRKQEATLLGALRGLMAGDPAPQGPRSQGSGRFWEGGGGGSSTAAPAPASAPLAARPAMSAASPAGRQIAAPAPAAPASGSPVWNAVAPSMPRGDAQGLINRIQNQQRLSERL
jgi:hypothetical protein